MESVDSGTNEESLDDILYDKCLANVTDDASSKFNTSPGGTRYWKPDCNDEVRPHLGYSFSSIEDGYEFYKNYGRICGFDVRRSSEKKHQDGTIMFKHFVCNRSGFNEGKSVGTSDSIANKNINVRRTTVGRCGCNAKMILKFYPPNRYIVFAFVEEHNHELVPEAGRQFLRVSRSMNFGHKLWVIDTGKVNMGPTKAHSLLKQVVGGYSNIGATTTDFKNFNRDVKEYIGKWDGQMIVEKFKFKKELCEGFFYDYGIDSDGHLSKLFWADPISRRNYDLFGDVISFDATFRTNKYNMVFVPFTGVDNHKKSVTFAGALLSKEDIEHYKWVFDAFLRAMDREPLIIITDQCPAMKQAIPAVFKSTRHRLCMWHIIKKFPVKIGASMSGVNEFMSKINNYIWDEDIEPVEFEEGWKNVVGEFGLTDNEWLGDMFENRHMWIPAYFRDEPMMGILRTTSRSESENFFFQTFQSKCDTLSEFYIRFESAMDRQRYVNAQLNYESSKSLPTTDTPLIIEKHASELYTRSVFYDVQEQLKGSCYDLKIQSLSETDSVKVFVIKDKASKDKLFNVKHYKSNNHVDCSCKMFLRVGILCSHAFYALNQGEVFKIPREFVLNRWMKNAERRMPGSLVDVSQQCQVLNNTNVKLNDIWYDIQSVLSLAGMDNDRLDYFHSIVKEVKRAFRDAKGNSDGQNKKDLIESIVGSQPVEVTIQPPQESRNQGCGKRILSGAERSQTERKKQPRVCKSCGKVVYHDSRNCPNKIK